MRERHRGKTTAGKAPRANFMICEQREAAEMEQSA